MYLLHSSFHSPNWNLRGEREGAGKKKGEKVPFYGFVSWKAKKKGGRKEKGITYSYSYILGFNSIPVTLNTLQNGSHWSPIADGLLIGSCCLLPCLPSFPPSPNSPLQKPLPGAHGSVPLPAVWECVWSAPNHLNASAFGGEPSKWLFSGKRQHFMNVWGMNCKILPSRSKPERFSGRKALGNQ